MFGILWDGVAFQFFKFDGTTKPYSFLRGTFPGDPLSLPHALKLRLQNLATGQDMLPFIEVMRQISETIFDLLLCGYIASIEAVVRRVTQRQDPEKWNDALESAKLALLCFRDAESKRQNLDIAGANQTVLEAQTVLNRR